MSTNLWPEIIDTPIRTPKSILTEQASFFNAKMKGILTAEVKALASQDQKILTFSFVIKAPLLDNYSVSLFLISHAMYLYPVEITYGGTAYKVKSEEELTTKLREILNTEEVTSAIRALYAQST